MSLTRPFPKHDSSVISRHALGELRFLLLDLGEKKISADASRYRVTYAALDAVSTYLGRNEWKSGLLPLRPEDIRGLDSYDDTRSEGHHSLSWIWKTNLQGGEKGLQEGQTRLKFSGC